MSDRLAANPRDWTADQLTTLIAEALKARELEAVPHLLTLLALKDPHQAEVVCDTLKLGLALARAGESAL